MKNKGFTSIELIIVLTLLVIIPSLIVGLGLWTDRSLDFWISYVKGHEVDAPYWVSLVASIVLNGVIVGLNILSEIARLFV